LCVVTHVSKIISHIACVFITDHKSDQAVNGDFSSNIIVTLQ